MNRSSRNITSKGKSGSAVEGPADPKLDHRTGAAEQLTTDEIILRTIVTIPVAIIVSSQARRTMSANAAALMLFGYDSSKITGMPVRALYGPEEDWQSVKSALSDVGHFSSRVTMRHASGSLFDADVSASATFDSKRQIKGVIETVRAVEHEAPASPSSDRPSDAVAVRLARGLAHDFNNLLAIITGNVQLAVRNSHGQAAKRYLRDAQQACDMAARLTRRVMSFAEDRHLSPSEISVATLFEAQEPLLKSAAGDAIALTCKITGTIPALITDRSALENALLNLVINARDAMPAGGSISVHAQTFHIDSGQAQSSGIKAGEYVCIAVSDTGTGMPERVQARAFDPFFTTKDRGRGTGLGLATVYGFAKQSGGTAIINSAPGKGTTVSLILPLVAPSSGRSE